MAKVIIASFVIQNWLIRVNEEMQDVIFEEWMQIEADLILERQMHGISGNEAIIGRDLPNQFQLIIGLSNRTIANKSYSLSQRFSQRSQSFRNL